DLLSGDIDVYREFFTQWWDMRALVFVCFSTLRIFFCIPSVVFMIVGSFFFSPFTAIVLTLIGTVNSALIVYAFGRSMWAKKMKNNLSNKYPNLFKRGMMHNKSVLAIGILCPIAPSDVLCLSSSVLGLNLKTYVTIVSIANLPMIVLYSFLGVAAQSSMQTFVVILLLILAISLWVVMKWKKGSVI
ncbi:MAG: TVP38/TMEM64 family protein, partial [Bacilli bacterium]